MILLDLTGPLTVFNIMQADVHLVAKTMQPVTTDVRLLIAPTESFETSPKAFDVLFVPGGLKGTVEAMKDAQTVDILQRYSDSIKYRRPISYRSNAVNSD